ncbi:MAG TPA: M56 family metallopeptidase [Mucilaginibacter sp.]|nr:M56 family metallopeptidase [Mucilaginibacter sp.]
MKTSFWTPYISDHTINAICWTLIHSIWIGLAVALLSGLVITFTSKSSAALRYRLLCGILFVFVASAGITFYLEMRSSGTKPLSGGTNLVLVSNMSAGPVNHVASVAHTNLFTDFVTLVKQNTNIIFMVWLLFFMLKSLKMVSGLLYIQRIRNYKVHTVAEEFKHKIALFSKQLGIGRTVQLMQSERVKIPVAIGWLKPVILLPMGIVLQLPAEQLDSILWHELAHIRRRDYLVNILQGLVETVFFFNPALLWLSSLIRAEREACCDDMVLSRMNRKANYLEALLAFGYEDNSRTSLVMSIGSGNQLRNRLKRMVSQENKRLSIVEKVVLAAGLILLSAFTALPKADQAVKYLAHVMKNKPAAALTPKHTDTLPVSKSLVLGAQPEQSMGKMVVNGPDTSIRFTSVLFNQADTDLANCEIEAKDDKGNLYHLVVANNKLTALDINNVKVKDGKLPEFEYLVREIDDRIAEKRQVMAEDMAIFKVKSPQAKFSKKGWGLDTGKKRLLLDWGKTDSISPKFKLLHEGSAAQLMKLDFMRKLGKQDSSDYAAQQQRVSNVIADLVAEKVVANAPAVKWFGLSNTEFIVNGQKQPEALQQKFKAKYGIREDYGLYYGPVKMTGTGVFIDGQSSKTMLKLKNLQRLQLKEQQLSMLDQKFKLQPQKSWSSKKELQMQLKDIQKFKLKQQELGMTDMKFKLLPQESWSPKQKLQMQLKDIQRLDAQEGRSFKEPIALQPIITNVIGDLVDQNIVKDKSDLSFKLTNKSLIVNGVKQPEEIHERFKNKYLSEPQYPLGPGITKDPNFGLQYDAKKGGMGIGVPIDRDDP